jgi:TolB-like protein/Flp pilus assembly protein TadD
MSEKPSFFSELKRRNVYKVAVAYAVVGWLVIQIGSTVLPTFHAPEWVAQVLVVFVVLGFPIALVLAWAFEITPEGIKRESEVSPNESITRQTGRKLVGLTIVVAVIAAGLLAFQLFRPRLTSISLPATTTSVASEKSTAVLPFENLSDDKSNAYFAEGIQDEILTRLSKIAALKVISRTSTQKYKSAPDNLREVGQQLGVANLLEGTVQKAGKAVHINVQLIKAATDEHLWAESYDRELQNIFGVEGEVAGAIADQLNAKLTGSEKESLSARPTSNPQAYDAYLRGLVIEQNQYGYESYVDAARNFAQAVQLDPKFAVAWARLGVVGSFLFFNGIDSNTYTPDFVKNAAERAMALAPDTGEPWIAQGAYHYRVLRDFEGAITAYHRAQALLPNNSYVLQNLAFVLRRVGRWQEAEANTRKALELDPLNGALLSGTAGDLYLFLRRFNDAHAVIDRAIQISPELASAHATNATIFQAEGRLPEAAQELAKIPIDATDDFGISSRVLQAMYERNFDAAVEIVKRKLRSVPAGQPIDSITESALVQMGFCQEWSGHHDDAVQSFNAIQSIKPTPETIVAPESNGRPNIVAVAYAGLDEKDKALQQALQAVKDYDNDAVNKPLAETALAQIQAHFGDVDSAIAAIPHLLEVPAGITRADLKFNPMWDPLRKDPRFQQLLQQKEK